MQTGPDNNLYDLIMRSATLPVLGLVVLLCAVITNFLMSKRWQQERRNRQIRKAVAERARRAAEQSEGEETASIETKKPPL